MTYYKFRSFSQNHTFHWIPSLMLFSVRFPTVQRLSIRGSFMFMNFGLEIDIDFKTN